MDEVYLIIADFRITLLLDKSFDSKRQKRMLSDIQYYFKGFISKKSSLKSDFTVEIKDLKQRKQLELQQSNNSYILYYKKQGQNRAITFYHVSIFQIITLLTRALHHLLSKENGFILHASSCGIDDKAYLFLGKSEAGKSTSVKLMQSAAKKLSDDLSIVRRIKKDYYLYQHPFTERNPAKEKVHFGYKLDKVFFLKKALFFKAEKKKDTQIGKSFLQQLIIPDSKSIKHALQFIATFDGFYDLYFAKEEKGMIQTVTKL